MGRALPATYAQAADDALAVLLEVVVRARPRVPRVVDAERRTDIPTFGDAIDAWLLYLRVEEAGKASTLQDAKNVANGVLLPYFGRDTPLYSIERREVAVSLGDRDRIEVREVRRDAFTTEDVDDFRRELLDSHRSPRTVQKILVLLHGVFKLAKRRKLISTNPSEDAERVSVEDAGVFNVLEPAEFELVYRAILGELDNRDKRARRTEDAIDALTDDERQLYGAALSTSFYAGPRMGEVRDLPVGMSRSDARCFGSSRATPTASARRRRGDARARRRSCARSRSGSSPSWRSRGSRVQTHTCSAMRSGSG